MKETDIHFQSHTLPKYAPYIQGSSFVQAVTLQQEKEAPERSRAERKSSAVLCHVPLLPSL